MVIGPAPVERSVVMGRGRHATPARTAGIIGGALGLAVVALFIVGARLAYRPPPQPKSTPQAATIAPARPAVSDPVTSTRGASSWLAPTAPVPSNPAAAVASPAAPRSAPRVESAGAPPRPFVPATVATSRPGSAPAAQASSSAHAPAVAASAEESEAADSTQSLVPVIPAGPPPEVDPLVRAVQHDIEEESRAK
jgi:hypothetical protein